MEKRNIVGIVIVVLVIVGGVLVVGGCAHKNIAPSDITITNTYQLKDISKNEMIREEARRRLIELMIEHNVKSKGGVDFVGVLAYNIFNRHHYLALEFKTKVVGYNGVAQAIAYLDVSESAGQYTVVKDWFTFSVFPETDKRHQDTFARILNRVKTCDGALPDSTNVLPVGTGNM